MVFAYRPCTFGILYSECFIILQSYSLIELLHLDQFTFFPILSLQSLQPNSVLNPPHITRTIVTQQNI